MRIAIDLSAVRTTGTKVYCSGFMPALGRLAKNDEFLVFMSPEVARLIGTQLPDNFQQHITTVTNRVGLRVLWEQIALPRYLKAWRADVLFAPFDMAPLAASCPILLAIRNPTPACLVKGWLDGSRVDRARAQLHRLLAFLSCRKARHVFYPSAYAARLLGDLSKVPPDKRTFVHHGTDYDFWSTEQESAPVLSHYHISRQRFVLFVSEFYFYKHPEVLIDGFAKWRNRVGQTDYKLVLVGGGQDKIFKQKLQQQVRKLGLENVVLFLGHVPRSHVAVLYQQTAAFVFPTVMETFGSPFVEAMASGAPVISADTEFAHELCGEAALYFPAGDAEALAQVLEAVLSQPTIGAKLREAGRCRAKKFSWGREAYETLALLKRVGGNTASVSHLGMDSVTPSQMQ